MIAFVVLAHGIVFIDKNADGHRDPGESGVANVVVAREHSDFVVTSATGEFDVPAGVNDIVWASVPRGYRPGPAYRRVTNPAGIDIGIVPLTPAEAVRPLTFVLASDSHMTANPNDMWDGGDLADAIDQAISLAVPPRFFAITGDVTQGGKPAQYDRVTAALATTGSGDVPWVPVPGNHDWYDGGVAYRAAWGPDGYSFDVDDVHVIVWNSNLSDDDQIAFIAHDVAHVDHAKTIVAMAHHSPDDTVADRFGELGVKYLFTGHWHANRRLAHKHGLIEWNTQTFVMGAIDHSPAGYRVVTFDHGVPAVSDRERLVEPHLAAIAPHAGSCMSPHAALIASVALDAATPKVTASIDCGPAIELAPAGGWDFSAALPEIAAGSHALELRAVAPSGRKLVSHTSFVVCDPPPVIAAPVVPPLQVAWATTIGEKVSLGSPVVSGEMIVIASTDRGSGDTGGLVALDRTTGMIRWRVTTEFPITATAAIVDDLVIATITNGDVRAYALATGEQRWSYSIVTPDVPTLASTLWAPPAIVNGLVYAGVQARIVALEVATGALRWEANRVVDYPWLGSRAAVGLAGDVMLGTFARDDGLTGFATDTGATRWKIRDTGTVGVDATPIIDGTTAYLANAAGEVSALDTETGTRRWTHRISADGFEWGYTITTTPALAGGRLFVPSQWGELVALDAATGAELWHTATGGGPLETAHYRSDQPGFAASPIVWNDLVWTGGPDGRLVARRVDDGTVVWGTSLGAPILEAPAIANGAMIVASYDGTVRALVPAPAIVTPDPTICATQTTTSGGCSAGDPSGAALLLLAISGALPGRRRGRARR